VAKSINNKSKGKRFMSANWKLYIIDNNNHLFHTYSKGPSIRELPEELKKFSNCVPVSHTSYRGFSTKSGYILQYLLNASIHEINAVAKISGKKLQFIHVPNIIADPLLLQKYNIKIKLFKLAKIKEIAIQAILDDIISFCKKPAIKKKQIEYSIEYVEKIEPQRKITLIKPGQYDLVKRAKGRFHDICMLDIGLDFSIGCPANITPELTYSPDYNCDYCYAFQNGPSFLETIYETNEKDLILRIKKKIQELDIPPNKPVHIRFGQTTEANLPRSLRNLENMPHTLKTALRAINELQKDRKILCAMPTKVPDFDDESLKLLKKIKIAVMASVVDKSLEKGMVKHGYTLKKRLEGILKLAYEGIATLIYIATNTGAPLKHMQDDAKIAMEFALKHSDVLGLQFLDIRATKKSHVKQICGVSWEEAKNGQKQKQLFDDNINCSAGNWGLTGQSYLYVKKMHQEFKNLIGDNQGNIRMCCTHADSASDRYCGKCFMDRL